MNWYTISATNDEKWNMYRIDENSIFPDRALNIRGVST